MAPVKGEVEKQRLFKCTNQFAYLERDEPRFRGDHILDLTISWSGSSLFGDDPDTMIVVSTTPEEAKEKMKQHILANPERFGFYGRYTRNYSRDELIEHFQKAFDQEVDEKNPKLGQHRIKIEEVANVIF